MDFSYFAKQIPKIKNLDLPGEASHFKMMFAHRFEELKAAQTKKKNPKKAAVLALFYPVKNSTHLLLILRKTYQGVHSNQIGFPGGKVEKEDADLQSTALREANEEVGVAVEKVEVLRQLSDIYIPPSNFEVTPFLGVHHSSIDFKIQESEVEALVEVSMNDFMNDDKVFEQALSTSYAENVKVPAYNFNGHVVWGATAMMLSEIKALFQEIF